MTIPMLVLGLIISIMLGAIFHLWRGGGGGRLLLYLMLGLIGFWFGELLARKLGISFARFGSLHLGPALLVELLFLTAGAWLSLPLIKKSPARRR
jgi:uncharacterized membrane protein YeaQ/YmgE (transglycosylase-associated protein family)